MSRLRRLHFSIRQYVLYRVLGQGPLSQHDFEDVHGIHCPFLPELPSTDDVVVKRHADNGGYEWLLLHPRRWARSLRLV